MPSLAPTSLSPLIQALQALIKLNQLQEKSYLTKQYQRSQIAHEKRLSLARFDLIKKIENLNIFIFQEIAEKKLSEKLKLFSKILLEEIEQIALDLISLGCIRFRIMEDPETLTLKDKLLKFSSMLSQCLESLVYYLEKPKLKTTPNLQLLKRQIMVLEEAFHLAYPLDPDEELFFSMDLDQEDSNPEDPEDPEDLEDQDQDSTDFRVNYDEAHMALQAFIYTSFNTYRDLDSLIQALEPWRSHS